MLMIRKFLFQEKEYDRRVVACWDSFSEAGGPGEVGIFRSIHRMSEGGSLKLRDEGSMSDCGC